MVVKSEVLIRRARLRSENRDRFSGGSKPEYKKLERPLCVQVDAQRSMTGEFVFMAEIAVRAWQTAARDIVLTDESRSELQAKFLRDLRGNADGVLLAERCGEIYGWGARVPKSNYISDLWVDPTHHSQGVGGALLGALMAQIVLDGFAEAEIGTHADNSPAIGLYEKAGFKTYHRSEEWSESFGRKVEKVRMQVKL